MQQTASKKIINGWAMYDWANSAYNLVITSTIFPAYYYAITTTKNLEGLETHTAKFLGHSFNSTSLYNFAIAFAYLVIAVASPILSSIADYKGNKKRFMQFFCYIGSLACATLFWFDANSISLGIFCCIIAAIGYCGSLVFYNSYLPEIASDKDRDYVSAKGFAFGYIGSMILQVICLIFFFKPELFGITNGNLPAQLSFLLVGVWWFGFAQITFFRLPKGFQPAEKNKENILVSGFKKLNKVVKQVKQLPVLKRYLWAFFFYSMGVQTVMLAATMFGSDVLKLSATSLIICILIIQLVAIAGAWLMAKLSSKWGNLRVLVWVVTMWMVICITAYFITTEFQFYIVAALVGLVMGGIQSLSRSTYARIMPETHDTASFFSFYDVTEKIAIVIGMFSFGLIAELTGNMRNSIISLVVFFAVGILFLLLAMRKEKRLIQK